jgi:hypothetical protein
MHLPVGLSEALFMVVYLETDIDVSPLCLVLLESFELLFSLKVVIFAHASADH